MIFKKLFGTKNQRELKRINKFVTAIEALEPAIKQLTDDQMRQKVTALQQQLQDGAQLQDILTDVFALVREASVRTIGLRHFDVQMIGGIALNEGKIAEMKTGEGKTLVATLAAFLNALKGSVHIVTVNDYLSKRDGSWMAPIYNFLGLDVGIIQSNAVGSDNSFVLKSDDFITTGAVKITSCTRKESYQCPIVYGTNNEFGFDYLRSNMVLRAEDRLQRQHYFAIVDEVDSILIDEARTPLIISGPVKNQKDLYIKINALIKGLVGQPEGHTRLLEKVRKDKLFDWNSKSFFEKIELDKACTEQLTKIQQAKNQQQSEQLIDTMIDLLEKDYAVDEKNRNVELTDKGFEKMEAKVVQAGLMPDEESLYSSTNINLLQLIQNAIKAHHLLKANVDYIIQNNEIVLVDEHTGRKLPGRRLSDGLHQAIEAYNRLPIQDESQTFASTTFQNYFRLYTKLAGMTGTADTEAFEFKQIYNLSVLVIPTNTAITRNDRNDQIYITKAAKYKAVINEIKRISSQGAPVLVGTISIEVSEILHQLLTKAGIKHNVLNAKFHEQEAQIIADAGVPAAVTIATNMAGRGTDIVLGGNLEVEKQKLVKKKKSALTEREQLELKQKWENNREIALKAGGLHIIGTERHESRRIDNQLRGRSGRQGDPGDSCFYLSMEDDLMRLFASDRVRGFMQRLGMDEDEVIEHTMVSNSIEKAQRKVETRNFDMRKSLLEYDDVANGQRQVIYQLRNEILDSDNVDAIIENTQMDVVDMVVDSFLPPDAMIEEYNIEGFKSEVKNQFNFDFDVEQILEQGDRETVKQQLQQLLIANYQQKLKGFPDQFNVVEFERSIVLQIIDDKWRSHLYAMDSMRAGINLRSYAQKNPKQEYKRESFTMFQALLDDIKMEICSYLAKVKLLSSEEVAAIEKAREREIALQKQLQDQTNGDKTTPVKRTEPKLGRNSPCHCGSGKKYKNCCGKLT